MTTQEPEPARKRWVEITLTFLKIGATAYGGPAIMGIMQAELQERRQWVSRERFVEGLSLVNLLPGAAATQLGIFLGHARGGWVGGLLAGLCFVLPAFLIMLALTLSYAAFGATPLMRGALYGLGPVVMGIFLVAVIRLGRSAAATPPQWAIAIAAALAVAFSPLGIVSILALAGGTGLLLFHSRRLGTAVLAALAGLTLAAHLMPWSGPTPSVASGAVAAASSAPGLLDIGAFFVTVGAFSFGGGLTLIAFIQDQVVNQYQWLTPREFIDGLALGQFTPGPILMVSAYVGYKLAGIAGAVVAAGAVFMPAFVIMLGVVPIFARVRELLWTRAAMKAIGPAVIGVLGVSLVRMLPHAVPDLFAALLFIATVGAMLAWKGGPIKLMLLGALIGLIRDRVLALPGLRAML